jgi:hypothetical protein
MIYKVVNEETGEKKTSRRITNCKSWIWCSR